jgi:amylosucrase
VPRADSPTPSRLRVHALALAQELRRELAPAAQQLPRHDAAAFLTRLERFLPDALEPLIRLYGDDHDLAALTRSLISSLVEAATERRPDLREPSITAARSIPAGSCPSAWSATSATSTASPTPSPASRTTSTTSTSSASPTSTSCRCCASREGENDGGYAVTDYRAVDPAWGPWHDLEHLAGRCSGAEA